MPNYLNSDYYSLQCPETGRYIIPGNPMTKEDFFFTDVPVVNMYKTKFKYRAEGFRDELKEQDGITVVLVPTPDIAFGA